MSSMRPVFSSRFDVRFQLNLGKGYPLFTAKNVERKAKAKWGANDLIAL